MQIAEGIFTIPDVLTAGECDEYIALTEAMGYEAAPITTPAGFMMRPDIRNNTRVILDDEPRAMVLWQKVQHQIPTLFDDWQVVGLNERFRFYRYDVGEQFALHRDGYYLSPNGNKSLLTFMIYLNEGFIGGETIFPMASITPKLGMALIFDHYLLHEGTAVISGRKYVLRSDVMYHHVGQTLG